MREFTVTKKDDGRKLEKWLPTVAPGLNFGAVRAARPDPAKVPTR